MPLCGRMPTATAKNRTASSGWPRIHQLAAEVGVDPEVVGVDPLGAPEQGDRHAPGVPVDARAKASRVTLASGSRSRSARRGEPFQDFELPFPVLVHPTEGVAEPVPPGVGVGRLGDRDQSPRPGRVVQMRPPADEGPLVEGVGQLDRDRAGGEPGSRLVRVECVEIDAVAAECRGVLGCPPSRRRRGRPGRCGSRRVARPSGGPSRPPRPRPARARWPPGRIAPVRAARGWSRPRATGPRPVGRPRSPRSTGSGRRRSPTGLLPLPGGDVEGLVDLEAHRLGRLAADRGSPRPIRRPRATP